MKIFLQPYIQELKSKVLEVARIDHIIAADCYRLALDISNKTHKTISQTTIKRIYGFAQARYAPSTFTLNALSDYCGYKSWANFIQHTESQKRKEKQYISWNEIALAAHHITRFTIHTNKRKCGLSYPFTIERKAINDHIENFLNSESTACVISAPSGSGKTIGITHWVDKYLTETHAQETNHIFLHVNSSSLFFAAGFGFHSNKWLAHLLNFPKHQYFEDFIKQHQQHAPGNFYLIIDDFNNNLINNRLFDILFRQLIDMVSYLSMYPWMKIIITMRPSTWQKYGYLTENQQKTKKLWFTNFIDAAQDSTNLPPFNTYEIQTLINKINNNHSLQKHHLPEKYFHLISLPLHFQYYHQLTGNGPIQGLNPTHEYAIISLHINKSILKGALAAEKQMMLNEMISLLRFDGNIAYLNKKEAYAIIKEHNNIYYELLHTGIIREFQKDLGTRASYQIRFQSIIYAAYFIAQERLEKYEHHHIDQALIHWLNHSSYPEQVKLAVLKWLIVFALENGDLSFFNDLQALDFVEEHQADLVLFSCSQLEQATVLHPTVAQQLNHSIRNTALIDIAFDHFTLDKEFQAALKTLLKYRLSNRQKVLLHTILGFFELIDLQDEAMHKHIEELQSIPYEHFAEFSINPLSLVENLHHYHRFHTLREDALQEITLFYTYPERNMNLTHKPLIYILGYMLLKIKNDKYLINRYLHVLNQYVIGSNPRTPVAFKAYLHLALAERQLFLGNLTQAIQQKEKAVALNHLNMLTRMQLGLLDLGLHGHSRQEFLNISRQLILIAKQFDLKYYEATIRAFLIKKIDRTENPSIVAENEAAMHLLFRFSNYDVDSFYNLFKAPFINSSTVN